ncbi:MAG: ATP-binding protein, partial [SAR324 cluster bacterium]|nr:ATP-binding protein [SAR324 cluster bacterium]
SLFAKIIHCTPTPGASEPEGHVLGVCDIEITVKDTGIGIDPKDHEIVFDKFQQAQSHAARSFGGTGLGLTICNKLAGLMNGEIHLTSELGKGSSFKLHLRTVTQVSPSALF